ncbi:S8/S53 family peptidase [Pedobacter sp. HDW13]|nr:S8/S53 family peptidase [Pedobacter sp. HDW13]
MLAGDKIKLTTASGEFNDYLGAAYFAEVISCRISKSVVLFKTSAFALALNYLTDIVNSGTQVHVVSMSMGGAPSRAWADAVNAAYNAGITIVTASGNNFAGLPTRHLVYPARFQRVIAACGVTYDQAPYYTSLINEMQGNYGPSKDMQKALAAYTPNMPWANFISGTVQFNGAGTSSATPQIAAAAAIYYKKNHKELDAAAPWQRVEAIRNALFSTAKKIIKPGFGDYSQYFGNGIVQALDALKIPVKLDIAQTPEDKTPWFPILDTLMKKLPDEKEQSRIDMFNTELWQLLYGYPELAIKIGGNQVDFDQISALNWDSFANAVIEHPAASKTLKAFLKNRFK